MVLQPLENQTLKEQFVNAIITQIITGSLTVGEKLPPEREISENMQISRNVVRVGIAQLTALGFLTVKPRNGTYVANYLRDGSLLMFDAVCRIQPVLPPPFFKSLMDYRMLVLVSSAGQCAIKRTPQDLLRLETLISNLKNLSLGQVEQQVQVDFELHKEIYIIANNLISSMIHNSMLNIYQTFATCFYADLSPQELVQVQGMYSQMVECIRQRDAAQAERSTRAMLEKGAQVVQRLGLMETAAP